MKTLNTLNKSESRNINGGKTYHCKLCGRAFDSYAKAYAHALACILRRYGRTIISPSRVLFI